MIRLGLQERKKERKYLLCSLIKNPEEEDTPRRTWYKFFEGSPLPPCSWSGNIVNRKPPRRGGGSFDQLVWKHNTMHVERGWSVNVKHSVVRELMRIMISYDLHMCDQYSRFGCLVGGRDDFWCSISSWFRLTRNSLPWTFFLGCLRSGGGNTGPVPMMFQQENCVSQLISFAAFEWVKKGGWKWVKTSGWKEMGRIKRVNLGECFSAYGNACRSKWWVKIGRRCLHFLYL